MADRKPLNLFVMWDDRDAVVGMARTAGVAEETGKRIETAGTSAGTKFGDSMDHATTRAGKAFSGLSSQLAGFGIPTGGIDKFASHLEQATTKGQKFGAVVNELGKVTLLGGAAGFAATAVEAIHLADAFDVVESSLKTAVANSGQSWDVWQGRFDAAYASAAKLGFENNDVAQSMQILTTATNSPAKALADLTLIENIARLRHLSLADAASGLAKVYAGNTRLLAQWGLNLDIGSGKLHSIQSAEESVQKAQLTLNALQAEANDGTLKGIAGAERLAAAKLTLRNAELNLSQSQGAVASIMDVLNQRTQGAAATFGKTFPGQVDIAKAEIHNFGVEFGQHLTVALAHGEVALADVYNWFGHNRDVAYALAAVVGGTLSAAVAVFTFNKLSALVSGLSNMASTAVSAASKLFGLATAETAAGAAAGTETTAVEGATAAMGAEAGAADAAAASGLGLAASAGPIVAGLGAIAFTAYALVRTYNELGTAAQLAAAAQQQAALTQAGVAQDVKSGGGKTGAAAITSLLLGKGSPGEGKTTSVGGIIVPTFIGNAVAQELAAANAAPSPPGIPAVPGIPNLGGVPSVGALGALGSGSGTTSHPPAAASKNAALASSGLSMLQALQAAEASGSALSLRKATTEAMGQKLDLLVHELVATHDAGLTALADQLKATWKGALDELTTVLQINQRNAYARQTALLATELQGVTAINTQMSANIVSSITDASQLAQDRASAAAQSISDQAKVTTDTLAERGLFGLALVAQKMQVGLDVYTAQADAHIATLQQNVDIVQQRSNASIGAAEKHLARVTAQQNAAIQAAQNAVDKAATGSQLQQAAAAAALKAAQAHAQLVEAQASAALSSAQNSANQQVAQAKTALAQAQSQAQVAEAQQQAAIDIEKEKAQTQFAGGGLQVFITGINPTDATAVASAVGWQLRTKVPAS